MWLWPALLVVVVVLLAVFWVTRAQHRAHKAWVELAQKHGLKHTLDKGYMPPGSVCGILNGRRVQIHTSTDNDGLVHTNITTDCEGIVPPGLSVMTRSARHIHGLRALFHDPAPKTGDRRFDRRFMVKGDLEDSGTTTMSLDVRARLLESLAQLKRHRPVPLGYVDLEVDDKRIACIMRGLVNKPEVLEHLLESQHQLLRALQERHVALHTAPQGTQGHKTLQTKSQKPTLAEEDSAMETQTAKAHHK